MDLKMLKENISSKSLTDDFFIFLVDEKDNLFLTMQYVQEISKILNKEIEYIDNLDSILNPYKDLFGNTEDKSNKLKICKCKELNISNTKLNFIHDLIIITNSISEDARVNYNYNIVNVPKLENWMIKDYALIRGKGVDQDRLEFLCDACNYDIYRIENELKKLDGFGEGQKKFIFKQMMDEGSLDDLTFYNMFSLSNAIQARDLQTIDSILGSSMEIDVMALISLLYQGFRKMIMVWLDKNPTPDSTGLKSNQIWAIRNLPRNYNKDQLIKIFKFLSSLDSKLKQGNLPNNNLIDYIIVKILSF